MSALLRLIAAGAPSKPPGIVAPFLYVGDGTSPRVLGTALTGVTWTPSLAALWRRDATAAFPVWAGLAGAMQTNAGSFSLSAPLPAFVPGGMETTFGNNNTWNFSGYVWRSVRGSFVVLSYVGDGTGARDVPHTLGAAPDVMWNVTPFPGTETGRVYWRTQGPSLGDTFGTSGAFAATGIWDNTDPTATHVRVASGWNASGVGYRIALWKWDGFNAAGGAYTGTGGALSKRLCGFRPRLLMVKRLQAGATWAWFDDVRDPTNPHDRLHAPATTVGAGEQVSATVFETDVDGWSSNGLNISGAPYVWMAMR